MKQAIRIPMFAYLLFLYNAVVYAEQAVSGFALETILYRFQLPSGATLAISVGESLLLVGLVAWYGEWTRLRRATAGIDRLSLLVLLLFLLEALLVAKAATALFFSLLLMDLLLVVAAYSAGIHSVRQDLTL
ncbi:MAG: hypothetical protein HQM04_18065 [Magnetococcales bacterium]|nr:hypothetical protein [Magnetococcales bacterium]MBF0116933.1 hypothetical protein [Magnetococcales bacterium]